MMNTATNGHPITEAMGTTLVERQHRENDGVMQLVKQLSHGRPILKKLMKQYQVIDVRHSGTDYFDTNGIMIKRDAAITGNHGPWFRYRVRYQWGFYKFTYTFN